MKVIRIEENFKTGKNVIVYDEDVYLFYVEMKEKYRCVYFNEPVPVKVRLIELITEVSDEKKLSLTRLSVSELTEIFIDEIGKEKVIIMFNNFERLTRRSVEVYEHLNQLENILFVCNFRKNFKSEVYSFFKTFYFANEDEYNRKNSSDEINVTYTMYLIIAAFVFLIYLEAGTSIGAAILLLGAAWFAFLIFRTFIFVGGKV